MHKCTNPEIDVCPTHKDMRCCRECEKFETCSDITLKCKNLDCKCEFSENESDVD